MPERPSEVPVVQGEELEARVEAFGDGPDGIVRIDRYVLFVPEVIPGERVRVRVTSAARKYGRAELVEVIESSPDRVQPRCPHFGSCGGCQLQHLSHAAQMEEKTARLRRTLAHALRREERSLPMRPMVGPPDPWEQRTKFVLHFAERDGELVAGFYARRSRELVGIEVCPIQEPRSVRVGLAIRDAARELDLRVFDARDGYGHLRAALIRSTATTGQVHATLVVQTERGLPRLDRFAERVMAAGASGVALNVNDGPPEILLGEHMRSLAGVDSVVDDVDGVRLHSSPGAFFQTSAFGVRALVREVRRILADAPRDCRIADLYCGGGLFALALAPSVGRVFGIEDSERAIADAIASAQDNGIENAHFRAGTVERLLPSIARSRDKPFAVILDPPRAGCDDRVLRGMAKDLQPMRVVYVSCEPSTLARDISRLEPLGYALTEILPVDMFPHTSHIETIAVLQRTVRREDPTARRLYERLRRAPKPPSGA
ncbi:MAG: 23S rRNA (uracil(1939)-C(5))-methyltransferase RlmD [Planctomycetota bacterium]